MKNLYMEEWTMLKQEYREKIEKVTEVVEHQQKELVLQRNAVYSEITRSLKEQGKTDLIKQLEQLQYLIDDAMYQSIFQAGIMHTQLVFGMKEMVHIH